MAAQPAAAAVPFTTQVGGLPLAVPLARVANPDMSQLSEEPEDVSIDHTSTQQTPEGAH